MRIGTVKVVMRQDEPNIFVGNRCNQDCLFCSEAPEDRTMNDEQIHAIIKSRPDTISFEGGEPTLAKHLPSYVRQAKDGGIRDIILCTNGIRLANPNYVKELCDAGITLFNINFPSHQEKIFDFLTQTKKQLHQRLKAIRTLIDVAGGKKARLNFIVNRLNFLLLEGYVHFVHKTFPEIFYIEFNLIKVLGYVRRRTYLVPRLADVAPRLNNAMQIARSLGLSFISDGFPLCVLNGYEHHAIDVYKKVFGDNLYMSEKKKSPVCRDCSLAELCAGPRKDYLELYGDGELNPSKKEPNSIKNIILSIGPKSHDFNK